MIFHFFLWYYGDGLSHAARAALAFPGAVMNLFSLRELAASLLAPWHGIAESYGRGFDASRIFFTFAGNAVSRVLGAVVRSFLIALGAAAGIAAAAAAVIWLMLWLLLPLIIPFLILWGSYLIVA